MRVRLGVAIVGAVLLATAAMAKTADDTKAFHAKLVAAYAAGEKEDCPAALALLKPLLDQPGLAAYPDTVRASAYELAAYCAAAKEPAIAHRYALQATAIDAARDGAWEQRLRLEIVGKRPAEAATTIEAMAARKPDALNALPIRLLFELNRQLRDAKDMRPARKRFLAILSAPTFQPAEITASNDAFRPAYAAMLAEDGDKTGAAEVVRQIEHPAYLAQISVDPLLRSMVPTDYDGRAAAERQLAKAREMAASHSGSMAAVLDVAYYLRRLGRPEEALATLEAARPDGPLADSFTDIDEKRDWWWDGMGRSYRMLGRYDDAVKAYHHVIESKANGSPNVSQTINLAYAYLDFGKWAQAVATVADFEKGGYSVSPYGLMQMRSVRSCARFLLGETAEAHKDLTYVTEHDKDDPASLTWLSLCANDMDGAAASIIRRLDDKIMRSTALLELSDYAEPPATQPQLPFAHRWDELKARADVKAAIERAGGTRRFNVQEGEF